LASTARCAYSYRSGDFGDAILKAAYINEVIGVAAMDDDGTIVMDLRFDGTKGPAGTSRLVYKPNDAGYVEVIAHLGALEKGKNKPIFDDWPA
jgi:hypothetical protein